MTSLELLILSVVLIASSFSLYLYHAIAEDMIVAKRYIRFMLLFSAIVGYVAILASCMKGIRG